MVNVSKWVKKSILFVLVSCAIEHMIDYFPNLFRIFKIFVQSFLYVVPFGCFNLTIDYISLTSEPIKVIRLNVFDGKLRSLSHIS